MRDGDAAEVGTIGNEGIVGFPVLMGDEKAPTSVYVQVPGSGLRIEARTFREELDRSGPMRAVVLRYAHAFFNQVAQSAACAHFHKLDERCCRWLLMTRDRMASDEFLLTRNFYVVENQHRYRSYTSVLLVTNLLILRRQAGQRPCRVGADE